MVGPKKQDFWPRINILKVFFFFKKSVDELCMVHRAGTFWTDLTEFTIDFKCVFVTKRARF